MDEREEEREFLSDLKARSGRDLADWMAAIAAQGFADKNDTIDWLRAQGFPFARASWLERIHSNGGKPIYLHQPARPSSELPERPRVEKAAPPPVPTPRSPTPAEEAQREKLLAGGKGYRPLYLLLEAQIATALPGVAVTPTAAGMSFGRPHEFAVVALLATELRLGLDLGERAFDAQLQKPRIKGAGPAISHMAVITDARQVNADLLSVITTACARVNP
jgi:hypothetical protein